LLEQFPRYHNHERPHQGVACANRPPSVAFPNLPRLRELPEEVHPDRWLTSVNARIYRRRVNSEGTIQIDRHTYSVGSQYAKQPVLVHLDAAQQLFRVTLAGRLVKTLPIRGLHGSPLPFWDYFKLIQAEARIVALHHAMLWERQGERFA
jgi:hypothetical protein